MTDATEMLLNKIAAKHADDAEVQHWVSQIKIKWRENVKKIGELEMIMADEKMEMYEDPIVVHAMHVKKT